MHRDLCEGKAGLCDAMKPTKGMKLLQYLRKVDFEGERFLIQTFASSKHDHAISRSQARLLLK